MRRFYWSYVDGIQANLSSELRSDLQFVHRGYAPVGGRTRSVGVAEQHEPFLRVSSQSGFALGPMLWNIVSREESDENKRERIFEPQRAERPAPGQYLNSQTASAQGRRGRTAEKSGNGAVWSPS